MYRLRFLKTIFFALVTPSRGLLETFELRFLAIPFIDTDFTRLFTQTYTLLMGLGRWHFVFNSQFRPAAIKSGWAPVTTAESIVYKRSIKALARIRLTTKMLCWNENRFYLEQCFYVGENLHARTLVEGLVRSPERHLKPTEVFKVMGVERDSPAFTSEISNWISSMEAAKTVNPHP